MTKKYRGHGAGSVLRRPNRKKQFLAQITKRGKRLSQSFATKTEAECWIRDVNYHIQHITNVDLLSATVSEATQVWLQDMSTAWTDKTRDAYEYIHNKYIIQPLGNKRVLHVTSSDIRATMDAAKENGASARDLRYIWQNFSSLFGYLINAGIIQHNPARSVSKPSSHQMHKPAQFFSKEQSDILVSYAGHTNDPLEHLYYLAISTGAREGELLGLKWQNINWETNSISIVQQVKWSTRKRFGDKNFMFAAPKTRKAIRHIKIGPDTIQRLREQEEKVRMLKQLKGADWQEHDLVFPSSTGTPIEPTNLNRRFKKLLKNASLPQYRFHELRHTHASLLLLQGTHPQIVSERLGHSDIATTLRLYSHVIPSLQNDAALNIEKILNQEI